MRSKIDQPYPVSDLRLCQPFPDRLSATVWLDDDINGEDSIKVAGARASFQLLAPGTPKAGILWYQRM